MEANLSFSSFKALILKRSSLKFLSWTNRSISNSFVLITKLSARKKLSRSMPLTSRTESSRVSSQAESTTNRASLSTFTQKRTPSRLRIPMARNQRFLTMPW